MAPHGAEDGDNGFDGFSIAGAPELLVTDGNAELDDEDRLGGALAAVEWEIIRRLRGLTALEMRIADLEASNTNSGGTLCRGDVGAAVSAAAVPATSVTALAAGSACLQSEARSRSTALAPSVALDLPTKPAGRPVPPVRLDLRFGDAAQSRTVCPRIVSKTAIPLARPRGNEASPQHNRSMSRAMSPDSFQKSIRPLVSKPDVSSVVLGPTVMPLRVDLRAQRTSSPEVPSRHQPVMMHQSGASSAYPSPRYANPESMPGTSFLQHLAPTRHSSAPRVCATPGAPPMPCGAAQDRIIPAPRMHSPAGHMVTARSPSPVHPVVHGVAPQQRPASPMTTPFHAAHAMAPLRALSPSAVGPQPTSADFVGSVGGPFAPGIPARAPSPQAAPQAHGHSSRFVLVTPASGGAVGLGATTPPLAPSWQFSRR
eukprot:CAMPEP_0117595138 /NCGR_PEP_ID=MMETSP0784-20121206/73595_1 /TAXON_ID=39447 /ORGANISM="" /LENGTH=426 /DNA_ID=CAMNT_0005397285 /DNA_START=30 /DNA_END=1310 /DNA_ORIENTATION=+